MSSLTGPVLAEYQDLYSTTTTQGGPNGGLNLGAKAYTGDGREFRFALAGATTLVPGTLLQCAVENTAWENLAVTATAIGATTVTTTTTLTVTANAWAGGYLFVTVTPGQGYQYKIKSNLAATSAVTTITLEDPILVALTTASRIDITPSPWASVIINPSTATGAVVGAAVFPITNAQYGWIQTVGPANVLAQGTVTVGTQVAASSTTAGAVVAFSGVLATVGVAITGIATTEYGAIDLTIG